MKWNPQVVIEEMNALGMKGADQVTAENFEHFAKKVRKFKREHGTVEKPAEHPESSRPEIKQEKKIEEGPKEVKVQIFTPGSIHPVLPPEFTPAEVKSLSMKELGIDPDRYHAIIDFGTKENYWKAMSKIKGIRGFIKGLNDHEYAFSRELAARYLEMKAGSFVRKVEGKHEKIEDAQDKEKAMKEQAEREAKKRERRAERRKERKKGTVAGKSTPRRTFKPKE